MNLGGGRTFRAIYLITNGVFGNINLGMDTGVQNRKVPCALRAPAFICISLFFWKLLKHPPARFARQNSLVFPL